MVDSFRSGISWGEVTETTIQTASRLVAEPAPMSFALSSGGEEIRGAPLVCIADLMGKVIQLLEQNMERYTKHYNSLTYMYM